ncbi:MAG: AAA family ATPase [Alteromonadaceae bacterium]|nr:AAA family ATPase [Alteromonadaceae bacterium]
MIKVLRTKLDVLDKGLNKILLSETENIKSEISRHQKTKQQRFSPSYNYRKLSDLKLHLADLFSDKCAYCESKSLEKHATFEQFRPKGGALGSNKGFLPYHYAWLSFEWENLYWLCSRCNSAKADRFPISGERAEIFCSGITLKKEQPLLLDPCDTKEITAEHIRFYKNGHYYPLDKKGETTIRILSLNRSDLVRRRFDAYFYVYELWTLFNSNKIRYEQFIAEFSAENEYAEARRQTLAEFFHYDSHKVDEPWFKDICSVYKLSTLEVIENFTSDIGIKNDQSNINLTKKNDFDEYLIRPKYIKAIKLENIGPIGTLSLQLDNIDNLDDIGKPPWAMILGDNGIGKSSILKAITFALLGKKIKEADFNSIVKLGAKRASIRVEFHHDYPPLKIEWFNGEVIREDSSDYGGVLLCYGSVRLLSNKQHQNKETNNYYSYLNLFDPYEPLSHPKSVIYGLDEERFNYFSIVLKELLSLDKNSIVDRENGDLNLNINGRSIPFDSLSDGYSSVVALVADIFNTIKTLNFNRPEDLVGIVLIDELGTHLHPSWRMKIVSALKKTFPKVQFICTTHEPLCLRGINDNEVVVLKRTKRHKVYKEENLPSLSGLKVEHILTSPHFGLKSTVEPEVHDLFEQYYNLLAKNKYKALSGKEKTTLEQLRKQVFEMDAKNGILGCTMRDKLIYEAVDLVIALEKEQSNKKFSVSETLAITIKELLTQEFE